MTYSGLEWDVKLLTQHCRSVQIWQRAKCCC